MRYFPLDTAYHLNHPITNSGRHTNTLPLAVKLSLTRSLESSWIILKLVIPIYILAEVLYFYNTLSYVAFIVEPFTSILGLPPEASMAIISGIFLNLYAAIAFAAPLDLTPHQWTVLAVFLGICHSMVIETLIMKRIGLSSLYSYSLRVISALVIAYLTTLIPHSWFVTSFAASGYTTPQYDSLGHLLQGSLYQSVILSLKIIAIISVIIFVMDYIKSRSFMRASHHRIAPLFSLMSGIFMGITYGAGVLIKESESLSKYDIFYIGTFLMICHAIIEDTLLFVIFGADFTMVILIRTVSAITLSYLLLLAYKVIEQRRVPLADN